MVSNSLQITAYFEQSTHVSGIFLVCLIDNRLGNIFADLFIEEVDVLFFFIYLRKEGGGTIQHRIKTCDWFLFLATANSMASRWCPWELGYADGQKQPDRIAIVQTSDSTTTHGNEYMQLYRRVDTSSAGELLWVPAGSNQGQFVRNVPFL